MTVGNSPIRRAAPWVAKDSEHVFQFFHGFVIGQGDLSTMPARSLTACRVRAEQTRRTPAASEGESAKKAGDLRKTMYFDINNGK